MRQDNERSKLGEALQALAKELHISLNRLLVLAVGESNRSRWNRLMLKKHKEDASPEQIDTFIATLSNNLKSDKRNEDIEKGRKLDESCYILTQVQIDRIYEAVAYKEEKADFNLKKRLKSLINLDSQRLRDSRLIRFVPNTRQKEIAEIAEHIEMMSSNGGYLVISGIAGSGKSTIIAQLTANKFQGHPYHFIPFEAPPDEHRILQRSLMALLTLRHPYLPDQWIKEGRTLEESFSQLLRDIEEQGDREIIFIDGLDQLKLDAYGERDLSFLPDSLPRGVLIVIGTRPDDTPEQLKLYRKLPYYELPELSRHDFDRLLRHQKVQLDDELADYFYEKLGKNALYLDLLAQELIRPNEVKDQLALPAALNMEAIIEQIEADPANIYSISINRLRKHQWGEVIRPVLGILLVSRQPLSEPSIRDILNASSDSLRIGLHQLGGLLSRNSNGQYALYHLKLFDYLRQDESKRGKNWVFTSKDECEYHKLLANWCEEYELNRVMEVWGNEDDEDDGIVDVSYKEQREYTQRHYITHLYEAKEWHRLWNVLDSSHYGQAKILHERSAHSYVEDLQLGRKAAGQRKERDLVMGISCLPKLWKYSLLRLLLIGQADRYPVQAFEALVLLERDQEAVGLAELLNDREKKIRVLIQIALRLKQRSPQANVRGFLLYARKTASLFSMSKKKAELLRTVADALVQIGERSIAVRLLKDAYEEAQLIRLIDIRIWIQCELAVSLYRAQEKGLAAMWIDNASKQANAMQDGKERSDILVKIAISYSSIGLTDHKIGFINRARQVLQNVESVPVLEELEVARRYMVEALAETGKLDDAIHYAQSMKKSWQKVYALKGIALSLAIAGEKEQALAQLKEAVEVARAVEADNFDLMIMFRWAFQKSLDDDQIQQYTLYGSVLCELSVELHAMGERDLPGKMLSKALAQAKSIDSTEAMANVTLAYIQLGERQEAEQLLEQIKELVKSKLRSQRDIERGIRALSKISLGLINIGDLTQANRLIEEMKDLVRIDQIYNVQLSDSINMRDLQNWAWMMVAKANAIAKNWNEAELALHNMGSSTILVSIRGALNTTVAELGSSGQHERALHLIHTLDALESSDKVHAFCELTNALARHGWKSDGSLVLEKAESIIRSYEEIKWWKNQDDLMAVIRAWASVEAWERVEALAEFSKKGGHIMGICEAAILLAQGGLRKKGLRLLAKAKKIYHPTDGVGDEDALMKAFAALGLWNKVVRFASSHGNFMNTSKMAEIIAALIKAGYREKAEQVANHIRDFKGQGALLAAEAVALAEINEWDEAEKIARSLEDHNEKAVTLSKIATKLYAAEQPGAMRLLQEAEEIIFSTEETNLSSWEVEHRNDALEQLSMILAEMGNWDKAEKVARSINDATGGSMPLSQLVTIIVEKGAKKEALRLVQRLYMEATTRETLVLYLAVSEQLLFIKPEIALELPEAVRSIECFLKGI